MKTFFKNIVLIPFIVELFLINLIYAPFFIFKYFKYIKQKEIMDLYNLNVMDIYKTINLLIMSFFVYSGLFLYMLVTSPKILFNTIKILINGSKAN
jgi:hypothetical protein